MIRVSPSLKYLFELSTALILAAVFSAGAALAAGSHDSPAEAGLPQYSRGATYVYADGSWETVLDSAPGRVLWEDHRGRRYSGSPDFTRRPAFWQERDRQVRRTFSERSDLFLKSPTSLWPLRLGNQARYTETGVWTEEGGEKRSYTAQWACEVTGRQTVTVPAGTFDAWKIECRRYSVSSNLKSRLRQTDTWLYADRVGHYVLKESRYETEKPARRTELAAVKPPSESLPQAARQLMDRSFQAALEKNLSGRATSWKYARDRHLLSGAVLPTDTFQLANGTYCRRYAQTISQSRTSKTFFGMACRSDEGIWYVPRR